MTDDPSPARSDESCPSEPPEATPDQLPIRSDQNTSLLQSPPAPVKVIIERSARAYFSTCRRLAALLNRRD